LMGMKNPWTINDPASFHPFVRSKQTIPSSRPVLPDVWLRAAVKHGRRPPRQRRVACLRAVRSHTTLDAGGRASTSASRPPLQRTGSGSGKSIKNRAHDSIKERDPAHNPDIEASRYFSVQLVDMYTFNFGYMGSRTTGNHAACNMITGPGWKGEKPAGVGQVFASETDFAFAIIRTQLFDPADIDNVKKIQAGYRAMTLSQFQNKPAPPPAPAINWPKIDKQMADANPFAYLNFALSLCPPVGPAAVEIPMRQRFAKIGIEAGKPFPAGELSPEQKAAFELGAKNGLEKIKAEIGGFGVAENGWRVTTNGFGDRQAFAGDFSRRAAAAAAGIYGNDAVEALYPLLATDNEGKKPDTSTNRYTLTFPAGDLPPANSFWSVTMYDGKTQLLVANPLNRYLINSPMLPGSKKNADGSLTIHIQKDSPGSELESNWLPAPDGPIYVVMRLYWPKEAALHGTWKPPALMRKF
jgi:hypothetical protein